MRFVGKVFLVYCRRKRQGGHMSEIYIDSQIIGGAVMALEESSPENWSHWNTESILTSTAALICASELRISPSARSQSQLLRPYAGTPGNHAILSEGLTGTIQAYQPDYTTTVRAAKTVAEWSRRNPQTIFQCLQDLKGDPSYGAWIDYEANSGWRTATVIINGIVDEQFLIPIANALNVSIGDARNVLVRSRNPAIVREWISRNYVGTDKEIAKEMFSVGALLRGRFQDRVAELTGTGIISHPLRERVLKKVNEERAVEIGVSNSIDYLAKIVIAASLTETRAENRISLWIENVNKVRREIVDNNSVTLPAATIGDNHALQAAVRVAQYCEIRAHSKLLESVVHHATSFGVGALTSFTLSPWLFPVGMYASDFALKGLKEQILPTNFARSKKRLSRLAISIPGRLKRNF
jgi:hypothetical protein